MDYLYIGLNHGATGAVRANASNAFTDQPATDWGAKYGVDVKHADCNGDGMVNDADTLAIFQNYGQTVRLARYQTSAPPTANIANKPTLKAKIHYTTDDQILRPTNGNTFDIPIRFHLGSDAVPAKDVYAIAFRLRTVPNGVVSLQSFFQQSWLGKKGKNMLTSSRWAGPDEWQIAITRTDHNGQMGKGEVSRSSCIVTVDFEDPRTPRGGRPTDSANLRTADIPLSFEDVRIITKDNQIIPVMIELVVAKVGMP